MIRWEACRSSLAVLAKTLFQFDDIRRNVWIGLNVVDFEIEMQGCNKEQWCFPMSMHSSDSRKSA
jgi:hypothetical protein